MRTIYATVWVLEEADDYDRFFDNEELAEEYLAAMHTKGAWERQHLRIQEIKVIQDGEDLQNCR